MIHYIKFGNKEHSFQLKMLKLHGIEKCVCNSIKGLKYQYERKVPMFNNYNLLCFVQLHQFFGFSLE